MRLGYDVGSTGADGKFGKNTEAGVIAFQKKNRLTVDGKYGEKTHAVLMAVVADVDVLEGNEVADNSTLPASDNIEIRYGNGEEYAVMSIAEKGTELTQVAVADNGWIAVVAGDKVGWVKK